MSDQTQNQLSKSELEQNDTQSTPETQISSVSELLAAKEQAIKDLQSLKDANIFFNLAVALLAKTHRWSISFATQHLEALEEITGVRLER